MPRQLLAVTRAPAPRAGAARPVAGAADAARLSAARSASDAARLSAARSASDAARLVTHVGVGSSLSVRGPGSNVGIGVSVLAREGSF